MRTARPLIACTLLWCTHALAADLTYVEPGGLGGELATTPAPVIVDARPLTDCLKRTLAGAHCLPATDLVGPNGELPSPPDLLWALGTAGLSGHERVVVVGDRGEARDFVAGLLYLAGQRRVDILPTRLAQALATGRYRTGPGRRRGIVRDPIFTAPMRDRSIVLHRELRHTLDGASDLVPVDGRTAQAFERGHIPGAINRPLAALVAGDDAAPVPQRDYVAYGQDPMSSIALFTRLRAADAGRVQVLIGGWRAWRAVPGYPVAGGAEQDGGASSALVWRAVGLVLVIGAVALMVMTFSTRKAQRWT
ncbi:MAG: rhodanese-like domain-containing protein [Gammaproteobacteria bacterium]